MKKTKLLEVVQSLQKWEIWHFSQFLNSPYFNKRTDVIRLWKFLQNENKKVDAFFRKEDAFQYVYPTEPFEESKYYLVTSYLFKLVEEFIAIQYVRNKDIDMKLLQMKAYRERKLETNFKRTFKAFKGKQNKQELRDSNFYRMTFGIESEYYIYLGSRSRSIENNLEQVSDLFDVYFIAEKLKQYCLQWAHQTVIKKEYGVGLQTEIMQFVAKHKELLEYPAIGIYYHCYQAISSGQEFHFEKLMALVKEHANKFTSSEIRSIYLLAINYCIRHLNTGDPRYNRKMFELYCDGVENGHLLENGELSSFTFNNTALLGIKLKEFDYVESFIETYHQFLAPKLKKNIYNYTLATLRYEQKQYPEAMHLLASFDSNDQLMNLNARLTLLKIYYELNEINALESLLESTRVYLNRKVDLGYHKTSYKNIISIAFKLLGLMSYDKKAKEILEKQIQEIKIISMRDWFLEQLEKKTQ